MDAEQIQQDADEQLTARLVIWRLANALRDDIQAELDKIVENTGSNETPILESIETVATLSGLRDQLRGAEDE